MYYGSDEFNNAIENTQGNALKTRLKFSNGEILELVSSMRYYGGSNDSDDISIGNTNMAYVEVSAFTDKLLTGREFLLESGVKLSNGSYEYAPIGYFTVQTPSGDYDEVSFRAYDRMVRFEKPYSSALTYPTNSAAILNEICRLCGVELATSISTPITITNKLEGYTCREVLSYIAGIHGFFVCIDRFGKLNIRWYSDTPIVKSLRSVWSFEKSQELHEIEKIEVAKDSETTFTSGDGIKTLYNSNPYATQEIVDKLYEQLGGYNYMPGEVDMLDDIRLDPWDVIQITYLDNKTYNIPVMAIEHDFGSASTTIRAVGKITENEYHYTGPTTNYLNRMATEILITNRVVATKVDAEYVKAHAITTDELEAIEAEIKHAVIEEVESEFIKTNELDAIEARIKTAVIDDIDAVYIKTSQLDAIEAEIQTAIIGDVRAEFATIEQLNSTNAQISTLDADVADINTLIFGSAAGTVIQTSFANAVIAQLGDAQIKSAMIQSVAAGKITAGTIYTDDVTIQSKNGQMVLADNTIQISDGTRVRVQIGKDASNDYSINIWDENGNLMFSKGGITDKAIKNAIIRNDMVSDTANINASKLDIDSLFSEINGSTHTIKSTKVYFDSEAQTLDVAFKNMSNTVDEVQDTLSTQGTNISVIQGQISAKIWEQDITTAVDAIEIGGRNLLINSAQWDDYQPSLNSTTHKTSPIAVTPGEQITISYYVKASEEYTGQTLLIQCYAEKDGARITYKWATADMTTEYTRKYITVTIPDGIYYIDIGLRSSQNVLKTYRRLKVESGNKATAWTAAPEDTDVQVKALTTKYTDLEMDINGFKATVASEYALVEDVEGIIIGGTNLLPDTNAPSLEAVSGISDRYWSDAYNTTIQNEFIEISSPPVKGIKYGIRQRCTEIASNGRNITWPATEKITLEDGAEYTLSCYARLTSGTKASLRFRMYEVGSQTSYLAVESTEWKRYSVTIKVNKATLGAEYCKIGIGIMSSYISTVEACGFKLEKGNKVTDWSPAPTDVDGQIVELSSKQSKLELNLEGFKTSVGNTYATKENLSTLEGQLSVTEQEIMSSVSQTYTPLSDFNNLGTNFNNLETDFNNLEIGASNILRYMNEYTEENKYTLIANKDNYNKLTAGRVQLEAGKEYTFSCKTDGEWLTGSSGDSVEAYLLLDGAYTTYFGLPTNPCTFTPTKSGLYTLRFDVNQNGATHSFWNIQIEKGNKATDWRQNLLDTESEISSVRTIATQNADKFSWLVSGETETSFILTDRMAQLTTQLVSLNSDVQISGNMVVDGAITTDKLAIGAVTADKIKVEDLYTLNAKIGGWDVKSAYIKNDALDSEGYVRRAYIQSMSAHEAEDTWVFSIQKSMEKNNYNGAFEYVWRVYGNGNMDTKGSIYTDDVLKVDGGMEPGKYSYFKGKLTVGSASYSDNHALLVDGDTWLYGDVLISGDILSSIYVNGDVITTEGASLNSLHSRYKIYSSTQMVDNYGFSLEPGMYLLSIVESLNTTSRGNPSLAVVYIDSNNKGWSSVWPGEGSKINRVIYGSGLSILLNESRYLTVCVYNIMK